jgi:branched-chain amino acid aminotransferase
MMASSIATHAPKAVGSPEDSKPGLKIWIDGELVSKDEAKISVFDHGLLYGDGVFEGIRIYNGRIFKFRSHLERMFRSAERIRLKPAYSIDEIDRFTRQTVSANGITNGYIRLLLTRGYGDLGLNPFTCPKSSTIIIADRIQLYPPKLYDTGIAVVVADRPRIPVQCLDPSVKSLNYLNNILAKIEAMEAEVLEAIMLNMDGYVAECTGDNIFIVKGRKIFTPPVSAGLLNGITRQFVISDVGPDCGFDVEEKNLRIEEVLDADEVFLTGTAAEVIGVSRINDTIMSGGKVGPITRQLTAEFKRRVAEDALED